MSDAPPRELGRVRGRTPGPTLMVTAGIHGNEPGGIEAARRVLAALAARPWLVRGELVAFSGNRAALREGRRSLTKDLNRIWTTARVTQLRAHPEDFSEAEDGEQREILAALDGAIARARGEVYFLDLHTTSAAGVPFAICGDTVRQREFMVPVGVPVILGLEDLLEGVLAQHLSEHGCVSASIEGGRHDDPGAVDNLEAALWLALESSGVLARASTPEIAHARTHLDARRRGLPRVLEVLRRHAITDDDRFVMEPGFANIDRAHAGQLLARDRRGEVRAPTDGMVILPLYQSSGSDGFFWGREVSEARLALSTALRRAGAERWLAALPGVRRDAKHRERFVVDLRVARLYPLEVFHLFGFRRLREEGRWLTVTRQAD